MLKQHIVLGTVQFGLAYGRRAGQRPLDSGEVAAILDAAWEAEIRAFDTAVGYGDASHALAAWLRTRQVLGDAHVVSKVSPSLSGNARAVEAAFAPFHGAASVTILSHGPTVTESAWRDFQAAVGACGAVSGQSVYDAFEVERAGALGAMRVQLPANLLDLSPLAAARAVELPADVRSVFLQGLLLDDPDVAEARVGGSRELIEMLAGVARDARLVRSTALLAVVLHELADHDRIVVGVDEPEQLTYLTDALAVSRDAVHAFRGQVEQRRALLRLPEHIHDPRRWPRRGSGAEPSRHA